MKGDTFKVRNHGDWFSPDYVGGHGPNGLPLTTAKGQHQAETYTVQRIADMGVWLRPLCRHCWHTGLAAPAAGLAGKYGSLTLMEMALRMRCSECDTRGCVGVWLIPPGRG